MHTDKRKAAEAFIEKVVAPARGTRSPDPKAARARAELARKNADLARAELAAGGLDPKRLDALAAERSKERLKLAEQAHRNAVEASAAAARRLRDLAPIILPIEPLETMIDTVTFIRSFAGQGSVIESNIGPGDNWARYRLKGTDDEWSGTGRLSFFTLWENQLTVPAVVMARASLGINAHLSCDADWSGVASWFGLSSTARATVGLRTTVWGMDSSISSVVQQQEVAKTSVDGGFFGDDSSTSIEFAQLLPASGVVVPAQTYVLIEVEVLTDWSASSGASVTFDAESGDHRVTLPSLTLTVTPTQPPPPAISLTAGVDYATSPAKVTLIWSGATGAMVDIYEDGVKLGDTQNDGTWIYSITPGTHVFRVCETQSSVCSNDVSVTVT